MTERIAIIGCGAWGSRVAERIHHLPGMQLHATQDRHVGVAEGLAHRFMIPWSVRIEDAVRGASAAVIATPPGSGRYDQVAACVAAGITHIRIEKPVALTSAEARQILDDFGDHAQIVVGHTTLYNDAVPYLRGFVDGIWREAFVTIRAHRHSTGSPAHDVSPFDDLAPHDIALLVDLLGSPSDAQTDGQTTTLKWPGVRATITHTFNAPRRERGMTIVADGTRLEYDEIDGAVQVSHALPGRITTQTLHVFSPHGALDRELNAWKDGEGTPLQLGVDVVRVMAAARRGAEVAA